MFMQVLKVSEVLMQLDSDIAVPVAMRTVTYMLAKLDRGFDKKIVS